MPKKVVSLKIGLIKFMECTETLKIVSRALPCMCIGESTGDDVYHSLGTQAFSKIAETLWLREWYGVQLFDTTAEIVSVVRCNPGAEAIITGSHSKLKRENAYLISIFHKISSIMFSFSRKERPLPRCFHMAQPVIAPGLLIAIGLGSSGA